MIVVMAREVIIITLMMEVMAREVIIITLMMEVMAQVVMAQYQHNPYQILDSHWVAIEHH